MRWLYHVTGHVSSTGHVAAGPEGFVHGSFKTDVRETIALHFANASRDDLRVLRIDPRRVADVRLESTPRGAMPHMHGPIERDAIVETMAVDGIERAPDEVTGTRFALVGFARMTLLDLVGVLDPLSRIASIGIDPASSVEVVSATDEPWTGSGARFVATRVRPPLADFDVLVVAGGPETRVLELDSEVVGWLASFPSNRIAASVCTGALLLGASGRLRGKRATTHHASLGELARHGATAVPRERVVRDGQLFTGGGVTAAIDVGLGLVEHIHGREARARIAARMEYPAAP